MRAILVLAAGCYAPTTPSNVPCAADGTCPRGQRCDESRPVPICVDELSMIDAANPPVDSTDAAIDAPSGLPAGLVMRLRMDDDPADGVLDVTGAHNGTCQSCPALVMGRIAMGYDFSNDVVSVPDANTLRPNTGFTAAGWVKVDAVAGEGVMFSKTYNGTNASYWISVVTTNNTAFFYTPNGTMYATSAITPGTWYHLALTWDGAVMRGYVNAAEEAMMAMPAIPSDDGALQIGGFQTGDRIDGVVDDIQFYSRPLTPLEIAQLMNAS